MKLFIIKVNTLYCSLLLQDWNIINLSVFVVVVACILQKIPFFNGNFMYYYYVFSFDYKSLINNKYYNIKLILIHSIYNYPRNK